MGIELLAMAEGADRRQNLPSSPWHSTAMTAGCIASDDDPISKRGKSLPLRILVAGPLIRPQEHD
jgi:hypothetical protein